MSRDRGDRSPRTLRSPNRFALATAAVTVLSVTASGCVVVHGEREVVPTATRADAARALTDFLTAYNKADKAYDRSLDASRVTGALGAIDGGKLEAGHKINPGGNPGHVPLKLTDAKFTIPRKAGWPRWFVADTRANKGSADAHWLLVFTRSDASKVWAVSYLTILAPGDVPAFKTDKDGWAEPVTADDPALAVQPQKLSTAYATYLRSGGDVFAPGPHTSQWRATRLKNASQPGLARQYIDESLTNGDYAPVGLRTTDGGALVFFATHHYERQTAAQGVNINISDPNIKALLTGEVKQSLTLEYVSNQAVLDPRKGPVKFVSRVEGLTGAEGE
ncbi:hypothetical protein ACWEWG_12875 [Streptomyces sp. NPDC003758]|uniref:DUF8094 domain-containing protein n=1 Tax=Streptomyces cynarae TaxID=2981134 RepID=A0ABY6DYM3_9ACTN|nr:hypothetical protein [Streptomyces cynarae]UXY19462.1 hypothetical protein N8I84_12525 [Streptomyces cynarae]